MEIGRLCSRSVWLQFSNWSKMILFPAFVNVGSWWVQVQTSLWPKQVSLVLLLKFTRGILLDFLILFAEEGTFGGIVGNFFINLNFLCLIFAILNILVRVRLNGVYLDLKAHERLFLFLRLRQKMFLWWDWIFVWSVMLKSVDIRLRNRLIVNPEQWNILLVSLIKVIDLLRYKFR